MNDLSQYEEAHYWHTMMDVVELMHRHGPEVIQTDIDELWLQSLKSLHEQEQQ